MQEIYPPKYYQSEQIEKAVSDEGEFETGIVSFGFTVNSSGRVINIIHIETQPPEFDDMRNRVRRNLRQLVYRPRLEDGMMVRTPEITFTHEFFYRPEDIAATPTKAAEADSTSR